MNCPNCSHANVPGAQFCGNCGFTLQTQTPQQMAVPLPQQPAATAPQPQVAGQELQNPQVFPQALPPQPQAPPPFMQPQAPAQPVLPLANHYPDQIPPQTQPQNYPQNQITQPPLQQIPAGSALPLLIANIANLILPTILSVVIANDVFSLILGLASLAALIGLYILTKKAKKQNKKYSGPAFIVVNLTVIIIVVVFVLSFISGFEKAAEKDRNKNSSSQASSTKNSYPAAVETNFIDTCKVNLSETVCSCIYDKIQENVAYDEFVKEDIEARKSGTVSPAFEEKLKVYASGCVKT